MESKKVIITGANSGIGKATALQFAEKGYTVIMACRNIELSMEAQKEIIEATNNKNVELMKVDMASFASIRNFCTEYKSKHDKVDILIHNAAYMNHGEKYQLSVDHIELTFATNVFGPYLMTTLLLDHLKKSDDPRILHAGSNIIKHFFNYKRKLEFNNLRGEQVKKRHSVYNMYCQSKMALLLLTFKMAEEYKEYNIKVYALQINGAKMSKHLISKMKPWWRPVAWVQNLYFPPTSYMGNNYYQICTAEKFRHTTGKLINDKLEFIQPGATEFPGYKQHAKQLFSANYYPPLPKTVMNELWELCAKLTNNPIEQAQTG